MLDVAQTSPVGTTVPKMGTPGTNGLIKISLLTHSFIVHRCSS